MSEMMAGAATNWQRIVVFVLVAVQVAGFAYLEIDFLMRSGSMDLITRGINQWFALLLIVPLVLMTLPALGLAVIGRWLVVAMVLAVVPIVLVGAVLVFFATR